MINGIKKRFIAEDLCAEGAEGVSPMVTIKEGQRQGDQAFPSGTILQFWSLKNGHYVCILDFEDWGSERCPRFTWYHSLQSERVKVSTGSEEWEYEYEYRTHYIRITEPSEKYNVPKDEEL